ncbi:Argininosuccinate lyase [Blumeria graminis f. sp. tritici 96224]|uniref:argininosuccinate lyase n=1 Tax=Blumeria graminis f. sp. tritici 96224 TaxID=1268274 RepID=A0A656KL45_BLUGR|nr:Argininosuccinate lyase [Blumeria graminis f. sp. tritici 96224]
MTGTKPEEKMLWGGRFTGGLDPLMAAYNTSIHFDQIFHTQDILGSIAWARANHKAGILTSEEFVAIESGLRKVEEEWLSNQFKIIPEVDEDIHTANERRLGELIGTELGGKLHTGRSRNEQIATDMRLWLRDELRKIEHYLLEFLKTMASRAEAEIEHVMPGYTHLQRAQPIRWSYWILSHAMPFAQDLERLREVIARVNLSPLGAGALAGNCFQVDRNAMASELGFKGLVSNRSYRIYLLYLRRWSEDLIVYSTSEFSFVSISDSYSTGSSLMPQKKNPDSLELLRGKSGRVFGQMAGLMMTVKGIPSSYNKDLQESVESMIDQVNSINDSIRIATGVLSTLTVKPEKMRSSLDPFMLATDLADYLVRKGVPFRETHHISGRCVAHSEKTGVPMNKMSSSDFKNIDERFDSDVLAIFDYEHSVEMHSVTGGTSRSKILEQINILKALLEM